MKQENVEKLWIKEKNIIHINKIMKHLEKKTDKLRDPILHWSNKCKYTTVFISLLESYHKTCEAYNKENHILHCLMTEYANVVLGDNTLSSDDKRDIIYDLIIRYGVYSPYEQTIKGSYKISKMDLILQELPDVYKKMNEELKLAEKKDVNIKKV